MRKRACVCCGAVGVSDYKLTINDLNLGNSNACVTLFTLDALLTLVALVTLFTLDALFTLVALVTLVTLVALLTLVTLVTLFTVCYGEGGGSAVGKGYSISIYKSVGRGLFNRSNTVTDISLVTLVTLFTLRACRTNKGGKPFFKCTLVATLNCKLVCGFTDFTVFSVRAAQRFNPFFKGTLVAPVGKLQKDSFGSWIKLIKIKLRIRFPLGIIRSICFSGIVYVRIFFRNVFCRPNVFLTCRILVACLTATKCGQN